MTLREVSLLRSSFQRISPVAEQAIALFYARLFELEPTLRDYLQGDMAEQGRKLLHALALAVNGIDQIDALAPAARQIGLSHASYHAKDRHYHAVGEALLWALGKGLGSEFTPETREAWGKTYWLLAETIKAGARDGVAKMNRSAA